MDNRFLFYGPGHNSPFDNLVVYINKKIALVQGMIGTYGVGTAAPTASNIPAGKYAVWYNTSNSTVGIYFNYNGVVGSFAGGGGGTISLTTTGTTGAAVLVGSTLNIPQYQGAITLTTTGTSGAATLSGNTLNIPQYSGNAGTVTSFSAGALSPLFGTSVATSTSTPALTFSLSAAVANAIFGNNTGSTAAPAYFVPTSTTLNGWFGATIQTAITLTTTGSSGAATFSAGTLNIPQYTGGASLLTRQSIVSGTSATGTSGNLVVTFNFGTTASTFNFTMPASPTDQQTVEFEGGGTLTSGSEVNSLTITPNAGQSLIQAVALTTLGVGEYAKFRYNTSLTAWMREI